MHPVVFAVFDEICRDHLSPGARVLEIGAMPVADTLLRLPALRATSRQAATQHGATQHGATQHGAFLRVGVNLAIPHPDPELALVQVAADGLAAFADASFDAVLCNSVLEHDPHFWRTCNGMLRVARSGALIAIGVPGYADLPPPRLLRLARRAARSGFAASLLERIAPGRQAATPTLGVHNYPGDYYRFSEQAMRDVLLAGCRDVTVRVTMRPPRIIGFGWRTAAPGAAAAPPRSS